MDDGVSVLIKQIKNGYLFDRSWSEEKEDDEGGCEYCHEEYFVKELPRELKGLFKKGYMKDGEEKSDEKSEDKSMDKGEEETDNSSKNSGLSSKASILFKMKGKK